MLALEVQKASFDENFTFSTSILTLTVRHLLSPRLVVEGELPYVHEGKTSGGTSNLIGNPYLGVALTRTGSGWVGDFGVRLPLADTSGDDDGATAVGFYSYYDRGEAYLRDIWSVAARVGWQSREPSGFQVDVRTGPILWLRTNDSALPRGSELFLDYGLRAG
ncbi:MAG: hypothetical protein ACREMM_06960 [Gemmatimonadales bacterium]